MSAFISAAARSVSPWVLSGLSSLWGAIKHPACTRCRMCIPWMWPLPYSSGGPGGQGGRLSSSHLRPATGLAALAGCHPFEGSSKGRRLPCFALKPCSAWEKLGKHFWALCPAQLTRGVKQTGPTAWKGLLTMGILGKWAKKRFFQGVHPKKWNIQ